MGHNTIRWWILVANGTLMASQCNTGLQIWSRKQLSVFVGSCLATKSKDPSLEAKVVEVTVCGS